MAASFSRTVRALDAESNTGSLLAMGGAAVVLLLWVGWLVLARVAVLAVSDSARLEVMGQSHEVQTSVAGRVVAARLSLGLHVKRGDPLVELDASAEKLQRAKQQSVLAAARSELEALRARVRAEEKAVAEQVETAAADIEEARVRVRDAEAAARLAKDEVDRLEPLRKEGHISEAEVARVRSAAVRANAAVEALGNRVRSLQLSLPLQKSQAEARLQALRGDAARLAGQVEVATGEIAFLDNSIEQRTVRAPVDGQVGRMQPVEIGAVVKEGDWLAAIIPDGRVRIVAQFAPPLALGRIKPGQSARLRLEGFPWTQFGMIEARVSAVGGEALNDRVRVELSVAKAPDGIPLQHSLPGTVEVETEQVSPLVLVLRAAGGVMSNGAAAPQAAAR